MVLSSRQFANSLKCRPFATIGGRYNGGDKLNRQTFDRLYTPWRMKYVQKENKTEGGCVFCKALDESVEHDQENFIVYRATETFAIMNIYPYNVGHLMVLPRQHLSTLSQLPKSAQVELMILTTYFTEILEEVLNPAGFNVGLNIGKAAGAGIDTHLHIHIVPRWVGDSNFMPVVGYTRVLPQELGDTYEKIAQKVKQKPPQL